MHALDSPLEALAFNYLSYGLLTAVNNIWTWLAVLTAAVSFWRIRVSSENPHGQNPDGSSQNILISSPPVEKVAEPAELLPEPASEPAETISTTKGKFSLYYCDEKESENYGDGCDGEVDEYDNGEKVGEGWRSKWEMVMKMRTGDDEWYRYQDFTAINGNVVRLWDGCTRRRKEATPLQLAVVGDFTWC